MADSGHSQGYAANKKKKRFPYPGHEQESQRYKFAYGIPRTDQARRLSMKESEDQDKPPGSLSQPSNKPPVILTKPLEKTSQGNSAASTPDGEGTTGWQEVSVSPSSAIAPKVSMTFKKSPQPGSSEKKSSSGRTLSESRSKPGISPNLVKQSLAQANTNAGSSPISHGDSPASKSKEGTSTKSSVKLLDAALNWSDTGIEQLQEQTDFLVIGVVGMQGVGKSTILSLLAGNQLNDPPKSFTFRPQSVEVQERAGHMTSGIDMAITQERIIILDTQPILSPSMILEQPQHFKATSEYSSGSVTVETQSLQMTSFLLTVCHVVVVVQDWFTDSNIFKFLQVAEMLKPVTPPPSHESTTTIKQNPAELQPVLVFVHNKTDSSMFNIRSIAAMNEVMSSFVNFSNLFCKSHFSLSESNLYPGLSTLVAPENEVNSFLFPDINDKENEEEKSDVTKVSYDPADQQFLSLPPYVGRPNTVLLENCFRKMMLSIPRHSITHQVLTEKNWFHYAARTWDAIRKSQLVSEYNRLLAG
uniref:Nonsense-mediated mRNA decay factor SMG9 n=1 Tax=Phallusia mammillata TaxID=59560 RepID=A0A6F9D8S1_9ASCI|nr:protein SMG9 [Phallusia mammillata]